MTEDTRAALFTNNVLLSGTGGTTTFHKDGLRFIARVGNTTTALACPAFANLPIGLSFTIDNTNGTGDFTLTPLTGTPIVANTGEVWYCEVTAAGTLYAAQTTAAPTS